MTVKELIQVLSKLPKDAVVGIYTRHFECSDNDSTGYDVETNDINTLNFITISVPRLTVTPDSIITD